jgi:glycosidase
MTKEKILKSLHKTYMNIYEPIGFNDDDYKRFMDKIEQAKLNRTTSLKTRDRRKKDWYQSEKLVGMTLYVDLFSNNIKGLIKKIPYFKSLGITFIHLMPLLKPREGNNDGGYAVEDYRDINPNLGTLEDFKKLVEKMHEADINIAIDFVINHTAKEHEWAKKAAKGDPFYQNMYMMYDSDEIPNKFNETVPEVLPDIYPGNFTYYQSFGKYVFKSFSEFQWDLNFRNPIVLEEILDIFFFLANLGVDVIRLDAIPFIWKELGTTCRNLPKVHEFMHLFHLAKDYVCPSVVILGEAIVEPHEIVRYFGTNEKPECQLMYNANMMVNLWNAIATRDQRLLSIDNQRFDLPHHGTWINYVRCHDDIGWGLNEEALKSMGFDPFRHKQFLINFYNGSFINSFARGENYQFNARTQDARTNGTFASLAGLEKALQESDAFGIEESIKRINILNTYMFSMPGFPLIYSGDEVAILNDYSHHQEISKLDGRWLHRPKFPWNKEKEFNNPQTPSGKIFSHIKTLISLRKNEKLFNNKIEQRVIDSKHNHIYIGYKTNLESSLLLIYNFSENHQVLDLNHLRAQGLKGIYIDMFQKKKIDLQKDQLNLYPYEYLWLKQ